MNNKAGARININSVDFVENSKYAGAFIFTWYPATNTYDLDVKDITKLKKGSTCTIKFNIWVTDRAGNEKPISASAKVAIK